ncbi:TniQ family protein [Rossellomorea marisflavi]|uniref:TniQ family protein n=1 Tax=Rossellomorea marisflavi TaxID=189381 RepID=UPI003457F532
MMSLSIRPTFKPGESVSSYLLRLCKKNKISLSQLLMLIKNEPHSIKKFIKVDVMPDHLLDVRKLSALSGVTERSIRDHSYGLIAEKLYGNQVMERGRSFQLDLLKIVVGERRRFCAACLAEDYYFRLHWQVEEMEVCGVHQQKLVDSCWHCDEPQPYMNESLMENRCPSCGKPLLVNREKEVQGRVSQLQVENWNHLLNPDLSLAHPIPDLGVEKTLALHLLHWQSENGESLKFTRNVVSGFRSLIKESKKPRSVLLSDLLHLSKGMDTPLVHLLAKEIPDSFSAPLIPNNETNDKAKACNSPWCELKGSNKGMKKVTSNYKRLKDKYDQLMVCTSCYIRYAYSKESNKWVDVEGQLEMIQRIVSLLNEGASVRRMMKEAKSQAYPVMGYIFFHRLVENQPDGVMERVPLNDPEKLYELHDEAGSMYFLSLYNEAKERWGWDQLTLACYLATPAVQDVLNFSNHVHKRRFYKGKEIAKEKVDRIASHLIAENGDATLSEVASLLGKNTSILRHYSLNEELKESFEKVKKKNKEEEQQTIRSSIGAFFSQLTVEEDNVMKIADVYSALGISRSYIRRAYLSLDQLISAKMKEHNEKVQELKVENLVIAAGQAVENLWASGEKVTMENIGRELEISVTTLYLYPEVMREISRCKAIHRV